MVHDETLVEHNNHRHAAEKNLWRGPVPLPAPCTLHNSWVMRKTCAQALLVMKLSWTSRLPFAGWPQNNLGIAGQHLRAGVDCSPNFDYGKSQTYWCQIEKTIKFCFKACCKLKRTNSKAVFSSGVFTWRWYWWRRAIYQQVNARQGLLLVILIMALHIKL